jgi:hypothetical protein
VNVVVVTNYCSVVVLCIYFSTASTKFRLSCFEFVRVLCSCFYDVDFVNVVVNVVTNYFLVGSGSNCIYCSSASTKFQSSCVHINELLGVLSDQVTSQLLVSPLTASFFLTILLNLPVSFVFTVVRYVDSVNRIKADSAILCGRQHQFTFIEENQFLSHQR